MTESITSFQEFKRRYPIRPSDPAALLGSGSYGRVVKVEDQLETEWVAIKISEFKGHDARSLKAEVELARRVPRQANIARYDACYRLETDTSISDFAIMRYYPDGNLADLLRRETLSPQQLDDITRGILLGLQHLHRNRIVHRDFKPANILISRDNAGRYIPKIADFGLSKLVNNDELDSSDFDLSDGRGTPSYKAPEQIEGSRVSFNLDLWAFGIILYEMLTGEKPFRADPRNLSEQSARREIELKIITVELPDRLNDIPEPYQTIIRRCLVRDIHERVRKEDELLDLLDNIPTLLNEARNQFTEHHYSQAMWLYEQVLTRREQHPEAKEGLTKCRAALEQQHNIQTLLDEADEWVNQRQYEQARILYEQVLRLSPDDDRAVQGLVQCFEAVKPKRVVPEAESTDAYEPERTDVYVDDYKGPSFLTPTETPTDILTDLPVPPTSTPVVTRFSESTLSKSQPKPAPAVSLTQPVARPLGGLSRWSLLAAAVLAGGLGWYWITKSTGIKIIGKAEKPVFQQPGSNTLDEPEKYDSPTLSKPLVTRADTIRRVNVAFGKARRAFTGKDYETTLMFTNSALQLDPTRKDVQRLRDAAEAEKVKLGQGLVVDSGKPEAPKENPVVTATETAKPTEPIESPAEKLRKEKQEQYDQLIEQGLKAVNGSNNKSKAMTTFTSAQSLAKEHDLNTTKADGAYSQMMSKGNKYFERDELEGAKAWYEVAQTLKNTDEVRRRIKQCSN
ncbi:protein kinase domain-containing protein [Larkinella sp. VNQ87]|uniref:serine/threonine-protein kinase n=1 Tax=Larkinella sp. VNQ87 TaxID=3400921 RepID=UPI003C0B8316